MACESSFPRSGGRELSTVHFGVDSRETKMKSFLISALLLLGGCMVGPKYNRPAPAQVPAAFKEAPPEGWKEAQPNDGLIKGKWWEVYRDPELNALEEQVNISNQNVLAAEAQFRQAKDAIRIARAALFPTLTAGASASN